MGIELDTHAARLLTEIGFLGISRGLVKPSEVVFAALCRLRPGEEAGAIGAAMVAMAQGAPDRAVNLLRGARQSEAVVAFRALAHARMGERAVAVELHEELVSGGAPQELIDIAREAAGAIR